MSWPEIPPGQIRHVPRIVRPAVYRGIDWYAERLVLVQWGDKELWWHKAHARWKSEREGYARVPAALITATARGEIDFDLVVLQAGSRLSLVLLEPFMEPINRFFGASVFLHIRTKRTTAVIDPNTLVEVHD